MSQDAAITCSEPPQRCAEKSWGYEAVVLSCLRSFAVRLGTLWAQTTRRIRFSFSSERRRDHHVVIILPSGRPLPRKRYPPQSASELPRSGDRPQRRADVFVHACLLRDSGERPDGALLAEALGERLLRLDDERRAELLKDLLEGLQRELRMTRDDPA